MRSPKCVLLFFLAACVATPLHAQQSPPAPVSKAPAKKSSTAPPASGDSKPGDAQPDSPEATVDPDAELQILVRQAGNDPATLIKNLEGYLSRYPDSPRRGPIYRALIESEMNLHNSDAALDYAEKVIAIQPEDSQSTYVAVTLLEKKRDADSLGRAADYDTRLIERVSKADPDTRPQNLTLEDWQAGRNKFLVELYVLRGRVQYHLHKNDDALKDLTTAFQIQPSAEAALTLGEIAEEGKRSDEAIRQYAMAFALAGDEQGGDNPPAIDRETLRLRIGNLWRQSHDSNAGLGDILLAAYDKNLELAKANRTDAPVYNKDVTDPLQFSLRRIDGSGPVKLADSRGKVVVVSFWTTWCAYCSQMETLLAGVRTKFAGRDDVVFVTVNADADESAVAPFVRDQKPGGTLVFSDGVNEAFKVELIPTVLVLDKAGKVAYRTQGYASDGFADQAASAITKATQ